MRERWSRKAVRALSSPAAPRVVLVTAMLLVAPSIVSGLAADDWFHRLVLTGSKALPSVHHRPLDLFVFSNGDPAVGHAQQEDGMIGWWADPHTKIAFFRPLSALSHWLDYQLFPNVEWAMHLHNLGWLLSGLVGLWALYRRFFRESWIAALALLLFAVDDAHGFVVSWVANRNALMTLALGVPVLALHDTSRRGRSRGAGLAAPLLFGVALLAGESAAAVGAYVFAYALFLDEARAGERLRSLVPYAVVFVAWRLAYAALGYGTHGSGLAVDPVHDPLGFLGAVVTRLPILLVAQLAAPPSDLWELYPALDARLQPAILAIAIVALGLLGWLFRSQLRSERSARFWALGTVLSTLPACSQVASDRLLLLPGVGAHALVASFFADALVGDPERRRGFLLRLGTVGLVVLHLVIAPLWLPFRARGAADVRNLLSRAERTVPESPDIESKTVVLVNPPADAFAGYLPMYRATRGIPRPARLRWLVTGATAATITRLDERTLQVDAADGFMSLASERMQRSKDHPMAIGDRVALTGMTVEVTAVTDDRRPRTVRATFETALEEASLVFLEWSEADEGFRPFDLPRVGDTRRLAKLDFTKLQF